jgi:hypothetical protein
VVEYVQRPQGIDMNMVRNRGNKGMDRCPLTSPPLQRCGVMTHKDLYEVAKSAQVKGMVSKMAALIWCTAPRFS